MSNGMQNTKDGEGESAFGEIDLKTFLEFLNTLAG